MIKCEVIDGAIQYNGEQPHLVFYVHTFRGQQYIAVEPFRIGDRYEDPQGVKHIQSRGYEIKEVYAIEPSDVSVLRGIYAQRVT